MKRMLSVLLVLALLPLHAVASAGILDSVKSFASEAAEAVSGFASEASDAVGAFASEAAEFAGEVAQYASVAWDKASAAAAGLWDSAKDAAKGAWNWALDKIAKGSEELKKAAAELIGEMRVWFNLTDEKLTEALVDLLVRVGMSREGAEAAVVKVKEYGKKLGIDDGLILKIAIAAVARTFIGTGLIVGFIAEEFMADWLIDWFREAGITDNEAAEQSVQEICESLETV